MNQLLCDSVKSYVMIGNGHDETGLDNPDAYKDWDLCRNCLSWMMTL